MQLSDFITYIKRDFKRTDKDTEILNAYNEMIKWLSIKLPVGDYKYQSYVTTSVGIEDYELPAELLHLYHPAKLLLGTNSTDDGFPLHHITKAEYDIREPNPNRNNPQTSRPDSYTVWSRSILLTPIPDLATYIMEINWSKRPVAQSALTDVPQLGSEYDETLKQGTLERVYAGMGQIDMAAYWGSKYHDAKGEPSGILIDLLEEETAREGNAIGHVRPNAL